RHAHDPSSPRDAGPSSRDTASSRNPESPQASDPSPGPPELPAPSSPDKFPSDQVHGTAPLRCHEIAAARSLSQSSPAARRNPRSPGQSRAAAETPGSASMACQSPCARRAPPAPAQPSADTIAPAASTAECNFAPRRQTQSAPPDRADCGSTDKAATQPYTARSPSSLLHAS